MPLPVYTAPAGFAAHRSNTRGLNSTASPIALEAAESSDLQNIDFDRFGAILKRNGSSQVNTTAFNAGATWTSLYWLRLSSGSDFLIGTCGNQFGTWSGAPSGSPTNSTGAVTITAGNNNFWQWVTHKDTALGANGVDAPIQWTGTGNAVAMTVPAGLTMATWVQTWLVSGYTFLANVTVTGTAFPYRLYWSAVDSIATWNAVDFKDFSAHGRAITGVAPLGDRLVIFTDRTVLVAFFTGDADAPFIFQPTLSHVGCISGYSIQRFENGLVFLSQDGLYYFNGFTSIKLSNRVYNTLQGYSRSRFQNAISAYQYEKNRYWLSMTSTGSTTDRIVMYDTFNDAFSIYKGMAANCFATVITAGAERIYFGDYSGFVYQADTGADDNPSGTATAIDAYYYTKWFDYDDLVSSKGVPEVVIYYDYSTRTSNTIDVSYSYDLTTSDQFTVSLSNATGAAVWDTALWDTDVWAAAGGSFRRLDLTGRGRVTRLKFSNNRLSETMKVNGFGVMVYAETAV